MSIELDEAAEEQILADKDLSKLERLTKEMNEPGPDVIWPMQHGKKATVTRLWSRPDVGVALATIETGAEFPRHFHDEAETMVVLRGKLSVRRRDRHDPPALGEVDGQGDVTIGPGAAVMLEPKAPHSVEAIEEDALVVVVTIPASEVIHGK